jgi:hypothetical protein
MVIAMSASPILGIVRGVKNGAVIHAVVFTERLVDLVNAQKKMSWFYLVLTARLQRTYNDN